MRPAMNVAFLYMRGRPNKGWDRAEAGLRRTIPSMASGMILPKNIAQKTNVGRLESPLYRVEAQAERTMENRLAERRTTECCHFGQRPSLHHLRSSSREYGKRNSTQLD